MDPRTQERVEQWDSRPFTGGQDGLADLADEGFSGVVMAGDVWLFVLNGRAVGIDGGDLEDLDASGTAYVAPDPAPPLLAAMKTRGGETRAKYYTNETPIEEVDDTLQNGSFTGYVELSEQVLSGDYYLVYYGGRRMATAYIGNAERLLTGEEAFERAADEVGIYEVIDVDIDVVDLAEIVEESEPQADEPEAEPEPEPAADSEREATAADDATPTADEATSARPGEVDDTPTQEPHTGDAHAGVTTTEDVSSEPQSPGITDATAGEPETAGDEEPASGVTPDEPGEPATGRDAEAASGRPTAPTDEPDAREDATEETESAGTREESTAASSDDRPEPPSTPEHSEETGPTGQPETGDQPAEPTPQAQRETPSSSDAGTTARFSERVVDSETDDEDEEEDENLGERFKQEERWRETRSIPSIDPDNSSASATRSDGRSARTTDDGTATQSPSSSNPASTRSDRTAQSSQSQPNTSSRSDASNATRRDATARSDARLEKLRDQRDTLKAKLEELQAEREQLTQKVTTLEDERDATREENRELSATVERLENRVEELEAELEAARSVDATGAVTDSTTGRGLSADRALEGTNLFVRYESKGKATLEKVHAGEADPEAVHANLHLDHHTEFDASEVTIDGTAYEEFLPTTVEYQFVDWLVDTLLYEIQDTGRTSGLADLYDAIPEIDRIEFSATVSLADDDTEDVPDEVGFDVVVFDKMGRPLVVANLNDSRDPATREMLERLEETASAVKANYPELAAAIAVTSSFFQPGALEVTEQATSGGFLSRSSKLNYVNVSRKQGYHLCLVEARSGGFHMTVPEL